MLRKIDRWREAFYYFRQLKADYLLIQWIFLKRRARQTRFLQKFLRILILVSVITLSFYLILVPGYSSEWTGFSRSEFQEGKTLWDWMELLLVPVIIAVGVYYLSYSERKSERERSVDQQRNETLHGYFDRMTTLLLDKDLTGSNEESEVRNLARSRSLAVLKQLDPNRKGLVMRFLYETGLIDRDSPIIRLDRADLSYADLSRMNLSRASLRGVNLKGANLFYTDFFGSDLGGTSFVEADLAYANLMGAHLEYAVFDKSNLFNANLSHAKLGESKLIDADLGRANLTKAQVFRADLTGANLKKARIQDANLYRTILADTNLSYAHFAGADLTEANLKRANLKNADFSNAKLTRAVVTKQQLKSSKAAGKIN